VVPPTSRWNKGIFSGTKKNRWFCRFLGYDGAVGKKHLFGEKNGTSKKRNKPQPQNNRKNRKKKPQKGSVKTSKNLKKTSKR